MFIVAETFAEEFRDGNSVNLVGFGDSELSIQLTMISDTGIYTAGDSSSILEDLIT